MIYEMADAEVSRCVLVIDDSEIDRRIARVHLAKEGIELYESPDGASGLTMARKLRPDLILLDIRLPDWDGFETIRRLKNDPLTRTIPVIFLSGSTETKEKAKGLDLGAVDFVSKPFDPVELKARVRVALRTKYLIDLLDSRANLDGLTGLGNRHAFEERIDQIRRIARERNIPITILMADLDHFKLFNDRYGHGTGDEVLRQAAALLRESSQALDFAGRYGGEEFVVIAPERTPTGSLMMAERFRRTVSQNRITMHGSALPSISVSIGVAWTFEPGAMSPATLIELADKALYQAKASGRNCVWYWDEALSACRPAVRREGLQAQESPEAPALHEA